MRLASIASGSSGNSTYVGSDHTHILVDAGISCKRISEGVEKQEINMKELSGIFITHEHSDHIQGLRVISKKYHIPIYGTKGTLEAVKRYDKKDEIDLDLFHIITADSCIQIGDLTVCPFSNTHDAADPVGYRVECGEKKIAIATDLGNFTDYTVNNLKDLDAILIEANHDVHMLEIGPYPFDLKRRILGDYGHLSNERCGELLCHVLHDNMKKILLGHLSKENNYPDLALLSVQNEVDLSPTPYKAKDFCIQVADRDKPSETITI